MLGKEASKHYLHHKRFNHEDKLTTICNFYNELKYCLELILRLREAIEFISRMQKQESIEDLIRMLRLDLHKFVGC